MKAPENKPTLGTQKTSKKYSVSFHALQMMKTRQISKARLQNALFNGSSRAAKEPGREVIRDGNLRLVVERKDNSVKVLTAMYADDLAS